MTSEAHSTACSTTPAPADTPGEVALDPFPPEEVLEGPPGATKEHSEVCEESDSYEDIRFVLVVRSGIHGFLDSLAQLHARFMMEFKR